MPDVTFKFDRISAYNEMLSKQRINMNRLIDELDHLRLDAHEMLEHMYGCAGVDDETASAKGAQVAKPVARIREGLESIRAGLGVLKGQMKDAIAYVDEQEAKRRTQAAKYRV